MEISSSTIALEPGMYILRHSNQGQAPLSVARAPGGSGKMETLGTDGTHGALLRQGGDCIALHITEAPVTLLVSAFIDGKNDPVPALRLDQIALDPEPALIGTDRTDGAPAPSVPPAMAPPAPRAPAPSPAATAIAIAASGISLIGHIERSGDVVAAPGQQLGDPDSLLRLEGFQVMWPDRPAGVDLACSLVVEDAGVMPIVKTGTFCGTRGEARPIIEVTFALIGPQAGQFRLEGMAHFSGGFQVPVRSAVALGGPSGQEHLTALSLRAIALA